MIYNVCVKSVICYYVTLNIPIVRNIVCFWWAYVYIHRFTSKMKMIKKEEKTNKIYGLQKIYSRYSGVYMTHRYFLKIIQRVRSGWKLLKQHDNVIYNDNDKGLLLENRNPRIGKKKYICRKCSARISDEKSQNPLWALAAIRQHNNAKCRCRRAPAVVVVEQSARRRNTFQHIKIQIEWSDTIIL